MQTHNNMNEVDIVPIIKTSVATIHTHWKSDGNLNFSGRDLDSFNKDTYNLWLNYGVLIKEYLVNRDGDVYKSELNKSAGKYILPPSSMFSIK